MTEAEWALLVAMRAEASPTPWSMGPPPARIPKPPVGWAIIGGDGGPLLTPGDTKVRSFADARLMAAAPALVDEVTRLRAALRAIVERSDHQPPPDKWSPDWHYQDGVVDGLGAAADLAQQGLDGPGGDR